MKKMERIGRITAYFGILILTGIVAGYFLAAARLSGTSVHYVTVCIIAVLGDAAAVSALVADRGSHHAG